MADKKNILVTGGAGYIGSHVLLALAGGPYNAIVIDDLSTGDAALIPAGTPFYQGDFADRALLDRIAVDHKISAVIHLAAKIDVAKSMTDPALYERENTLKITPLLDACAAHGVHSFLFSSTAAVYGIPPVTTVTEQTPCAPLSPYGTTKLASEKMIADFCEKSGMAHGILRYFNVAGADGQGRAGQPDIQAKNLIAMACKAALGIGPGLVINGNDYDTPDGTCIRDYIHVSDLAAAHVSALHYLLSGSGSFLCNCGYGHGFSVMDIVNTLEKDLSTPCPHSVGPRRDGDIPNIIADAAAIRETLGWRPHYDDIRTILATELDWQKNRDLLLQKTDQPPKRRSQQ